MSADGVIRKFATDEPMLAEPRNGIFVRFMEALMETRRRQARREIAKHVHLLSNDPWQQLNVAQLISGEKQEEGYLCRRPACE